MSSATYEGAPPPGRRIEPVAIADQSGRSVDLGRTGRDRLLLCWIPTTAIRCPVTLWTLRDSAESFTQIRCTVLGVTTDAAPDAQRMRSDHGLAMNILCDTERELVPALGWDQQSPRARTRSGSDAILLDRRCLVLRHFRVGWPHAFADDVLDDLTTTSPSRAV